MKHPNIINYFSIEKRERQIYRDSITIEILILMEYMNYNLTDFIEEYKNENNIKYLPIDIVLKISYQILQGIYYLHSNRIMHRDLKLENVLIEDLNSIKITDFGYSINILKHQTFQKRTILGSPGLIPPEVLMDENSSFESDMWTFGCIMYQLISGEIPYNNFLKNHGKEGIIEIYHFANPLEDASDDTLNILYDRKNRKILKILRECWRESLVHRISSKELLEDDIWNKYKNS